MESVPEYRINVNADEPDFSCLSELKTPLKERLIKTIREQKKYFILTGSEPGVKLGCCPSQEVEEANMLVRAGILCSNAQPVPEGSCPVTTYAFKDEMLVKGDAIQFSVDQNFRSEVLKHLSSKRIHFFRIAAKWALLVFIFASLIMVIYRMTNRSSNQQPAGLYEQLDPAGENQVLVVMFHFRTRCEICLNMERFTRAYLDEFNAGHPESDGIQFKLAVIDDNRNINLVKRFNVYTSTLLFIEFEQGREKKTEVLDKAWQLYRDQEAYQEMLEAELTNFITRTNE